MMMPNLRAIRESRGLTLEIVARDTGIPESTLQDWEVGRSEPEHLSLVIVLENYLGELIRSAYYVSGDSVERAAMLKLSRMSRSRELMLSGLSLLGISPAAVAGLDFGGIK